MVSTYSPLVLTLIIGLVLLFIERVSPLRERKLNFTHRLFVNVSMAIFTLVTAVLLVHPAALWVMKAVSKNSYDLLHMVTWNPSLEAVIGFVLLDLSFYYWHRLNHKSKLLWRFHNVHHLDPELDITTGFRFHWGEVAFSTLFRIAQVIIIGPSLGLYLTHELFLQLATLFHHSNIRLPKHLDEIIKLFIVTPRMHSNHHSKFEDATNSNYSVIFSFWDRLHKTYTKGGKEELIEIGVPAYSNLLDNTLKNLLFLPFKRQKEYWKVSGSDQE